jgi:hypothetical protein
MLVLTAEERVGLSRDFDVVCALLWVIEKREGMSLALEAMFACMDVSKELCKELVKELL